MSAKVVSGVTQQRAVLQGAGANLESKCLRQAEHIRAGDFKYAARAGRDDGGIGVAARWCRTFAAAARANLLDFEAYAVADGIALAFLQVHDDGLVGIGAGRILRLDLHAVKYAEVVKAALRVDHIAFAQRSARFDFYLTRNHAWPGKLVARDQNSCYLNAYAFYDVIGEPNLGGRRTRGYFLLKMSFRETF